MQNGWKTAALSVCGALLVVILTAYISSVSLQNQTNTATTLRHAERISTLEANQRNLEKDVREIKESIKDVNGKLDTLLNRTRQ